MSNTLHTYSVTQSGRLQGRQARGEGSRSHLLQLRVPAAVSGQTVETGTDCGVSCLGLRIMPWYIVYGAEELKGLK